MIIVLKLMNGNITIELNGKKELDELVKNWEEYKKQLAFFME